MHRTMQCLTALLLCIAFALTGCSGLFGDQVTSTPELSVTPAEVPSDNPATTGSPTSSQSPSPSFSASHLWFRLGPPNSSLGTVTQGEPVQVSIDVGSVAPQRLNRTVVIQLQQVTTSGEIDRQILAQIPISIPPNGSQQINRTLTFSMTGTDLRFVVLVYRDVPTGVPTEATAEISLVRNVTVVAANTTTTELHTRTGT